MFSYFSIILSFIFVYSAFVESSIGFTPPQPESQTKSPYKVTGVACLKGEYCELIQEGEYKGYYIKSNIPLDDPRIKNIRENMFAKAVLSNEKVIFVHLVLRTLQYFHLIALKDQME